MTPEERARPEIINGSRRTRIAVGSGTEVGDVNRLVKQFGEMQKMMKRFGMTAKPSKRAKKGKKGKPTGGKPRGLPPGSTPSPAAWTCPVCLACPTCLASPACRTAEQPCLFGPGPNGQGQTPSSAARAITPSRSAPIVVDSPCPVWTTVWVG